MKIAAGMIVLDGDYVLNECIESIYPFVDQIVIAEGPVRYWQDKGKVTSSDDTNPIIHNFPDLKGKIKIKHGLFEEKDDQVNAYVDLLDDDID